MNNAQTIVNERKQGKHLSGKTKQVTIHLAALTRVEYSETVEVPVEFDKELMEEIVLETYDAVDGGEYNDDMDFWEKGNCYYEEKNNG